MRESKIEEAVCKYAEERGFLQRKFSSPGHASVPDRMFVHPTGYVFFIEFKATGFKPTPAQEREHVRLRNYNVAVSVCDDIEQGKKIIDAVGYQCLGC